MRKFEIIMSINRINRQLKKFIYSIDRNINPTAYRLLHILNKKPSSLNLYCIAGKHTDNKLIKNNYIENNNKRHKQLTEKGLSTLNLITENLIDYINDILAEEKLSNEDLVKANKILRALTSKISTHDDDDERIKLAIAIIIITNQYSSLISYNIKHKMTPIPEKITKEYEQMPTGGYTILELLTTINKYKLDVITAADFNELNYSDKNITVHRALKALLEKDLIRPVNKKRTRPKLYYVNYNYIDTLNELNKEAEEIYNRTPLNSMTTQELEFANNFFYNLIRIDH